jgi:hypothetical protein
MKGILMGFKKDKSYGHGIFTDRMTDKVTYGIIMLVRPSIIFLFMT